MDLLRRGRELGVAESLREFGLTIPSHTTLQRGRELGVAESATGSASICSSALRFNGAANLVSRKASCTTRGWESSSSGLQRGRELGVAERRGRRRTRGRCLAHASTGPRTWCRGKSTRGLERNAPQVASTGPRTWCRGKVDACVWDGQYARLASTGPRTWCRGKTSALLNEPRAAKRFNGAANLVSRKVRGTSSRRTTSTCTCFNGAANLVSRKATWSPVSDVPMSGLQRGRELGVAES